MTQGREHSVAETFVELADTLASDYDVGEFLHMLVERGQEVLNVDAGGVLLESRDGALRLAAATSEKMARYEEAETRHNEGPCIDAYRHVKQIVAEDLTAAHERWPKAVAAALKLGLQAVYAFPLKLRADCIGALNLYRERVGPFDEHDVRMAQAFADVAAIGILQQRHVSDAETRARQLQEALDSRIIIEQAKGVLLATTGMTPDAAFEMLRTHARSHRLKLHDVAAKVVESQSAGLEESAADE